MPMRPAVLLAALSAGCSQQCEVWHSSTYTWDSTDTVTYCIEGIPHPNEVRKAFEVWNRALNGWKALKESNDCTIRVSMGSGAGSKVLATATGSIWTSESPTIVFNQDAYFVELVLPTAVHEIGHVLGAWHVSVGTMSPTYSDEVVECPDEFAVAQVAAAGRIPIETMSWCSWGECK